ncbi:hypothetical protein GR925_25925 [Streptomyces sp. HUCO-GS316]|uniref:hypothetical protein n=1 Tax=Streptomyces sp. HUCO-GS316 TaxID=2692198 RepID=UPI00136A8C67|nr:hypothetical protein [Streptomyces sp. HUCO-GS316]MXM66776.1 hypothetical protein [Streptomyces sp. HUCO-GS316]
MNAPSVDALLPMAAALVLVTLLGAPAGWRMMGRIFLFGLVVLAVEVALITAAPGVWAWITEVIR